MQRKQARMLRSKSYMHRAAETCIPGLPLKVVHVAGMPTLCRRQSLICQTDRYSVPGTLSVDSVGTARGCNRTQGRLHALCDILPDNRASLGVQSGIGTTYAAQILLKTGATACMTSSRLI